MEHYDLDISLDGLYICTAFQNHLQNYLFPPKLTLPMFHSELETRALRAE